MGFSPNGNKPNPTEQNTVEKSSETSQACQTVGIILRFVGDKWNTTHANKVNYQLT